MDDYILYISILLFIIIILKHIFTPKKDYYYTGKKINIKNDFLPKINHLARYLL
jgi:hypothetical protein